MPAARTPHAEAQPATAVVRPLLPIIAVVGLGALSWRVGPAAAGNTGMAMSELCTSRIRLVRPAAAFCTRATGFAAVGLATMLLPLAHRRARGARESAARIGRRAVSLCVVFLNSEGPRIVLRSWRSTHAHTPKS